MDIKIFHGFRYAHTHRKSLTTGTQGSVSHSRNTGISALYPLVFCVFLFPLAVGAEQAPWDIIAMQLGFDRYPQSFLDSLKKHHEFSDDTSTTDSTVLPFTREKLVYDGGWGIIRAAWGILTIEPDTLTGKTNIIGKLVTNNFFSRVYKVRDYIHAHVEPRGLRPVFWEQHIKEGNYIAHRWTAYDQPNQRLLIHHYPDSLIDVSPDIHNYLSLFTRFRAMDFSEGDMITLRCYVHKKDYPISFSVLGIEQITVPAGTFSCYKVVPTLVGEGGRGVTKRDKMFIWVTTDKRHIPVKLSAKIAIGAITADLLEYSHDY